MISHSDNKKDKKNGVSPDIYIDVSPEMEGKLYMQAESEDNPKNKDKKEDIKDEVLETAIKIIKADKINEYIEKPSKYEQDFPKEEKKEVKENNDNENKTKNKDSSKEKK